MAFPFRSQSGSRFFAAGPRGRFFGALAMAAGLLASAAVALDWSGGPTAQAQVGQVVAQAPEAYTLVDRWVGRPVTVPAGFVREPGGVAVAEDGAVYLTDVARGQVHVFDGVGWTLTWGGSGPGKMGHPHGVAVVGDRVYVADTDGARVAVFDRQGNFVSEWLGVGRPWGLAAMGDDRLLVSDNAGDRLLVVDLLGRVRTVLGGAGAADPLSGPKGVAAWPDGEVAVLDAGHRRVAVWARDGTLLREFPNASQLPLMDVGALGNDGLLVAGLRSLTHYNRTSGAALGSNRAPVPGGFAAVAATALVSGTSDTPVWAAFGHDFLTGLRRFDDLQLRQIQQWEWLPGPPGEMESPRRIAAFPGGLDIVDAWPRVQRLAYDGTPLGQNGIATVADVVPSGAERFVGSGKGIRRFAGDNALWAWTVPFTTSWLVGLDRDPVAADLVTLDMTRQELVRVGDDGALRATASLSTAAYASFTDLAVRADGSVLIVNRSSSEVEVRSADGTLLGRWPVRGVPLRVAADTSGGAFVLTREGWVWKLAPDGAVVAWWDAAADAGGRRGVPTDLALGPEGRVYVTDGRADEVRVYAEDPDLTGTPGPGGDGCVFIRDKWAAPKRILLGKSVQVTLTVAGTCLGAGQGADIMLVVDRSGSMQGQKMEAARAAAIAFAGEIDFNVSRVGLVVFNSQVQKPLGLTADPGAFVAAVAGFAPPAGGTDIGAAIQLAAQEFSANGRPGVEHILIVMTDGRPEGDVVDADAAADAAKAAGVRIFSIGFGADADPDLMRRIASRPEDYFFAPGAAELSAIYTEIARRITGGVIAPTATITDVVPTNMTYLAGSAVPPVESYSNRVLTWELTDVAGDVALTYRLRPEEVGVWPTNREAWFRYLDGLGMRGRLAFPVPEVEVVAGRPIYLPVVSKLACRPTAVHADVVIVVDTSSSMAGDKLAAAKAAAELFVDRLRLPLDQAALVSFNRRPTLVLGLTGDRFALRDAIRALNWTPGTVIDAAIDTAAVELGTLRHRRGNNSVIVLLTDGQNNAGPEVVMAAAERARGAEIVIFTVALGDHADRELMRRVAGDDSRAFVALGPADLDRIYEVIAGTIPCGVQ